MVDFLSRGIDNWFHEISAVRWTLLGLEVLISFLLRFEELFFCSIFLRFNTLIIFSGFSSCCFYFFGGGVEALTSCGPMRSVWSIVFSVWTRHVTMYHHSIVRGGMHRDWAWYIHVFVGIAVFRGIFFCLNVWSWALKYSDSFLMKFETFLVDSAWIIYIKIYTLRGFYEPTQRLDPSHQ